MSSTAKASAMLAIIPPKVLTRREAKYQAKLRLRRGANDVRPLHRRPPARVPASGIAGQPARHRERAVRGAHVHGVRGACGAGGGVQEVRGLVEQVERAAPGLDVDPGLEVAGGGGARRRVEEASLRLGRHGAGVGDALVEAGLAGCDVSRGVVPVALGDAAADLLLALHHERADVVQLAQVVRRVGVGELERAGHLGRAHRLGGQQRQDAQPHRVRRRPQPRHRVVVRLVHATLQEFLGSQRAGRETDCQTLLGRFVRETTRDRP